MRRCGVRLERDFKSVVAAIHVEQILAADFFVVHVDASRHSYVMAGLDRRMPVVGRLSSAACYTVWSPPGDFRSAAGILILGRSRPSASSARFTVSL